MTTDSRGGRVDSHRVLLIGPYDPHCGEYTFLAPPLGVWRLQGVLEQAGVSAEVFDPNCCDGPPEEALAQRLRRPWSVVGISTTGMTLAHDLALAHQARQALPGAVLVAGGMEATFKPDLMFEVGPFDLVALGEGEKPLLDLVRRLEGGGDLTAIAGTAWRDADRRLARLPQVALEPAELRDAVFATPYERMPYAAYWRRLEAAYRVGALPMKADREARLAEIRSVRLNTLNYCPMGCTFCSSTNFLHAAQGSNARIRRLDAAECLEMIRRIVSTLPDARTIIFQDDIFVFTKDDRILPLCRGIVDAKRRGDLPRDLQFISTNRIDAMNGERLAAMRAAGFRVLGFGVESFSPAVLAEFNKGQIYRHIEPMLAEALRLGITPFLDLILTSPRCGLEDLGETVRQAHRWLLAGCEIGMYPYVIPFSGAAMASDPTLAPFVVHTTQRVAGTAISWRQPTKIPPLEPVVRRVILEIEARFESWLEILQVRVAHLPSRVRSLVWTLSAAPVLEEAGVACPSADEVIDQLLLRLPGIDPAGEAELRERARGTSSPRVRREALS
jgi:radical SAM superfamily enzyme YgiQ (UPF0313 family)